MKQVICLSRFPFPDGSVHCGAYYDAFVNGKNHYWAHFPICDPKNCPIQHPELLKGAVLQEDHHD